VVSFGAGKYLRGPLNNAFSRIENDILRNVLIDGTTGGITGFGTGAGMAKLNGASWSEAVKSGLKGAGTGAAIGTASGAARGYLESRTQGNRGYRYVTEGEIKAIEETGYLRGGREGETYFTKDKYKSGTKTQERLSLEIKPTHRIEFEITNNPKYIKYGTKVIPDFNMPGKGSEFMTTDKVRINLKNWNYQKLGK